VAEDKPDDNEVPSSKYGTRRFGRLGRHDGRNIKRLWKAMIQAGAVHPDGNPLSSTEVLNLPNQPFSMNALTNHLANKPYLFVEMGRVRVAGLDGKTTYDQSTWVARPDAFDHLKK
jgi:hypothetical protein